MDDGSNLDESITSSSNNDDVNGNSSTSEPNLQVKKILLRKTCIFNAYSHA